jgi:3',5'-cyclic AMP phosphodiesterase CpdA
VTQREAGDSFVFALLTDTHIAPQDEIPPGLETTGTAEQTLLGVAQDIRASSPDFIANLGDVLDFHRFGFNLPPPDGSWTRLGYLNYRRLLGDTLGNAAHFVVIGNWDGETGCYTEEEISRSREQRVLYAPGPGSKTYPQGGSPDEDYYAFTWGDALFVVLNVMSYTPTCHMLSNDPGFADDWTLGEAQLAWFEETLQRATSKWRFVLIHHTVGGAAADEINSAYGRGGGQAARVGEQEQIHELMLENGVQIFFYGHDHVFTDIVVDDIHYTLPGSAGAPWLFSSTITGYEEYWPQSGHARVEVTPDGVNVQFIGLEGDLIHQFTVE